MLIKRGKQYNDKFKMLGRVLAVPYPALWPFGVIKEINLSEIVVQYKTSKKSRQSLQKIDIIWADYVTTHHLKGLSVKTVADISINKAENENERSTRQQTVALKGLTLHQKKEIERLIKERGSIISMKKNRFTADVNSRVQNRI